MAFDWKDLARPAIVGAVVVLGLKTVSGVVAKLTFIPTGAVGDLSIPTLVGAGVLAFVGTLLADMVAK